ncbi:nucleoside-diphosphate sugar epimerase [Mucor ambiguus]|uniref:Nucleoside-diphosphate sugar epimerase n=1 Tax=Mucor ambiguus TaxID=91626 RepID=A0A0C9N175_9FUNG|nr:nucleoside-diphosphate sugar epimerase [Mucor ambiguus]
MTNTITERMFIIGGTGNAGTKTVQDLVSKNISVTLYARNPSKVAELFSENPLINVIHGDLADLTPLKEGLSGHTRLFLLYSNFEDFIEKKVTIAKLAYAAGIKQIVDVSSITASESWRSGYVGAMHRDAEQGILNIPNRGTLVALRPGRFMSNLLTFERPTPDGVMYDAVDADDTQGWISPNDIGAVAAAVLSEDIKKHGDMVYELIGDVVTLNQRSIITSRILERPIRYQKVSTSSKYDQLMKTGMFPHGAAYNLAASIPTVPPTTAISTGIPILIGREPETLEQYILSNKAYLS